MVYRKLKPMPNEQVERNRLIVERYGKSPGISYEDIGKMFGITKQRVYQIIKRDRNG